MLGKIYLSLTPSKTIGTIPSQNGAPTTVPATWLTGKFPSRRRHTLLASLGVVIGKNSVTVDYYRHLTNDLLTESSKTNNERRTGQLTIWQTIDDCLTVIHDRCRIETHQWHYECSCSQWHRGLTHIGPITSRLNWPIRSITRVYTINWRDTTHFDSEDDYRTGCRNVSPTATVLFRTTFTYCKFAMVSFSNYDLNSYLKPKYPLVFPRI